MFEIFNDPLRHNIGTSHISGWNQSKSMLTAELNKLFTYYRNNITFLPNQHFLVRLLSNVVYPTSGSLQVTADTLSNYFQNTMTQLGIGSPFGRPDFSVNSWFFNKRTYEIIMMDDSSFDADDVYENWKSAKPIKVLHHPFNDLSLAVPNGKVDGGNVTGYAVVLVNPAMLAIQFKGYLDGLRDDVTLTPFTIGTFLHTYPILNMMGDMLDITIRNRLTAMYVGRPLEAFKRAHQLGVNNLTSHVDNALRVVLNTMRDQVMTFDKLLETIPSFTKVNQRDITPFPLNSMSKNTLWIYDVARAPLLDFLVRYNNDKPNYQNLQTLNLIKRSILEMELDKSIPSNASPVVKRHIDSLKEATSNLII